MSSAQSAPKPKIAISACLAGEDTRVLAYADWQQVLASGALKRCATRGTHSNVSASSTAAMSAS
ncbi:hypothetical protein [Pseudomonas sp. R5(2019)]|uniref:hypothetical protein n=1 Tax=Pseudomonas sp. R5(2019) TaxID=2697566 RepID=UPI001411F139|nr:hypothetical protein [Pseudomonas sp. R5(2019)]NBA94950.1 hypothetical protein [Pseudomonas sp. R5(2019)]